MVLLEKFQSLLFMKCSKKLRPFRSSSPDRQILWDCAIMFYIQSKVCHAVIKFRKKSPTESPWHLLNFILNGGLSNGVKSLTMYLRRRNLSLKFFPPWNSLLLMMLLMCHWCWDPFQILSTIFLVINKQSFMLSSRMFHRVSTILSTIPPMKCLRKGAQSQITRKRKERSMPALRVHLRLFNSNLKTSLRKPGSEIYNCLSYSYFLIISDFQHRIQKIHRALQILILLWILWHPSMIVGQLQTLV